jgi:hypothetical protein
MILSEKFPTNNFPTKNPPAKNSPVIATLTGPTASITSSTTTRSNIVSRTIAHDRENVTRKINHCQTINLTLAVAWIC